VLDASPLMTVQREEPGAAAVEVLLDAAAIGAVNLSEVQAKLVERGTSAASAWSWLTDLDLEVVGLSLADRACLTLAQVLDRPAITADRACAGLEAGVEIRAIR
jgi:ribonuclease VapC